METVDELQDAYIADLRALLPELVAWWKALAGVAGMDEPAPPEIAARWPTGISGHPRVLEVFQTYFFELDDLNELAAERARAAAEARARGMPEVDASAVEDEPEETGKHLPVDVLINDIGAKAPDLGKLVQGIIMVPVGLMPDGEFF